MSFYNPHYKQNSTEEFAEYDYFAAEDVLTYPNEAFPYGGVHDFPAEELYNPNDSFENKFENKEEAVAQKEVSENSSGRLLAKFLANFIIIALFIVVVGKVFFTVDSAHVLLYLYGISVTLVLGITMFFSLKIYRDPYDKALESPLLDTVPDPFVSCMVAVHNEEKIIEQCIHSFLSQTYKHKEIIFVNDKSTDNTAMALDWYAEQGLIRVLHLEKNLGKKKALGMAMAHARGSMYVFSDSDSVLAPDAVEKSVAIIKTHPDVGALSGHCRPLNADTNLLTVIQDSWYEGQFSIRKAFESIFDGVSCVSGPLAVFRKEAIFNYIPAWENDTFLGQEFKFSTDRTLTGFVLGAKQIDQKLKTRYADSPFVTSVNYEPRDWKIVYSKTMRAWTEVPDTLGKMLKQQIRWKKSFIRNIFFTGTFYWRRTLAISIVYYLHVLFVIVGPLIVYRHLIYFPSQGDVMSAFLYLSGIVFVGLMFGLAHKLEDRENSKWIYRPLMSLFSTIVLSPLLFYSALTIKNSVWHRG